MAFLSSIDIVGSALSAERFHTDIIAQNLANAKTTVTENGGPYRRQQLVFAERPLSFQEELQKAKGNTTSGGVRVAQVVEDEREFNAVYDPDHPQANEDGYVLYPNVDTTEEMVDLMAASNAYDANLTALSVLKAMINKTIEMKK